MENTSPPTQLASGRSRRQHPYLTQHLIPVPVHFPLGQGLDLAFEFEEAESQGQEVITPCCIAHQLAGRTCREVL